MTEAQRPLLGSCLSGIGGIDLGFLLAGWDLGWQVERDPFKREVLRQAWPAVPKYEDLLTLDGVPMGRVDCVTIDCPTHRYREDRTLLNAALRLGVAWQASFFALCTPCSVQFRDNAQDWQALQARYADSGYHLSSLQTSCGHGSFWWERTFVIGHRQPLRGGLADVVGRRAMFGDAAEPHQRAREALCYGALEHGDFGQSERDYAFPNRWTCICNDRASNIPCVSESRALALRQSVCVDVAAWIGKKLLEEFVLLSEAPHVSAG